jgi:hypothetical protein
MHEIVMEKHRRYQCATLACVTFAVIPICSKVIFFTYR